MSGLTAEEVREKLVALIQKVNLRTGTNRIQLTPAINDLINSKSVIGGGDYDVILDILQKDYVSNVALAEVLAFYVLTSELDLYLTEKEANDLVNTKVERAIDNKKLIDEERANEIVNTAIAGIEIDKFVSEGELTETLGSYSTTKEMETTISAKIGEYSVGVKSQFSGLQKQIDGAISTWYFAGEPTLTNQPAVEWTTDEEKENHSGDLYYDNDTGYCYRWQKVDGAFTWVRIADEDISKALSEAQNARAEAQKAQDMEIGGRNLAWFTDSEDSIIAHGGVVINSGNTPLSHRWNITKNTTYDGTVINPTIFTAGETYTISYFIRKTAGTLSNIGGHMSGFTQTRLSIDGKETSSLYANGVAISNDTAIHYIVLTAKYNGGTENNAFYIQPNRGLTTSITYDLYNIKVEKGEKATDFTPAWEEYYTTVDTDAEIKIVDSRITSEVSTITNTLTTNYYNKTQIDQTTNSINLNVTAVSNKVDNIQVGGRNLIIGSIKYTKDSPYSLTPTSNDTYVYLNDLTFDVIAGKTYVLSCNTNGLWSNHQSQTNRSCTIWIASYSASDRTHQVFGGNGTETGRKYWTYTADKTEKKLIRINVYGAGNSAVKFWDFKLEEGNKGTDWTPAPEDVQQEISKVEGKIVLGIGTDGNGKKYSYLNANADYIKFESGDLEINSSQFSLDKAGNATFKGKLSGASGSFTGTVTANYLTASSGGKLSGWTFDGNSMQYGTLGQDNSMWLCTNGTQSTTADIAGSGVTNGWCIGIGNKFGVKNTGEMFATAGKVGCMAVDEKTLIANNSIGFVETTVTDVGLNGGASPITFVSGGTDDSFSHYISYIIPSATYYTTSTWQTTLTFDFSVEDETIEEIYFIEPKTLTRIVTKNPSGTVTEEIPFTVKSITHNSNTNKVAITIEKNDTAPTEYSWRYLKYNFEVEIIYKKYSTAVTKLLKDGTFKTSALMADGGKIADFKISNRSLISSVEEFVDDFATSVSPPTIQFTSTSKLNNKSDQATSNLVTTSRGVFSTSTLTQYLSSDYTTEITSKVALVASTVGSDYDHYGLNLAMTAKDNSGLSVTWKSYHTARDIVFEYGNSIGGFGLLDGRGNPAIWYGNINSDGTTTISRSITLEQLFAKLDKIN